MATTPGTALSSLRIGVGAAAWATPNLAGRLFGLDLKNNPQAPYFARLFGARDIALAVGTQQTTGSSRRVWWQIGIACDALDVAAAALAVRNGSVSKPVGIMLGAPAVAAVGMGIAALVGNE